MMRKKNAIALLFYLITSATNIHAEGEPALLLGMGGVKTLQDNSQTLFYNPSYTSVEKKMEVGLNYSNSYCMKELSTAHLYSSLPTKLGTFNIGCERFGNQNYNKNLALVGYANRWGKFSAGINFNYLAISVIGSELGQMIYSQIGTKAAINKSLTTSFSLTNIEQSSISIEDTKINIPTNFTLGLKWSDNKCISIYLEAEKSTNTQLICKCAAEYSPSQLVAIRLGALNKPLSPTMGIGLTTKGFTINFGVIYNTQLGASTALSLSYIL